MTFPIVQLSPAAMEQYAHAYQLYSIVDVSREHRAIEGRTIAHTDYGDPAQFA